MKAHTLLILFTFFQVLFCDLEGLSLSKIQEIYEKTLPYMKAFHPENIYIPFSFRFLLPKFNYDELGKNNTHFSLDEYNVLHVKFINLKGKMTGRFKAGNIWKTGAYQDFVANLTNITYEQSYNVKTTKEANEKYSFKYRKVGESELNFKVSLNFTSSSFISNRALYTDMATSSIKNLNFTEFRAHLGKLQGLLLDNIATELSK